MREQARERERQRERERERERGTSKPRRTARCSVERCVCVSERQTERERERERETFKPRRTARCSLELCVCERERERERKRERDFKAKEDGAVLLGVGFRHAVLHCALREAVQLAQHHPLELCPTEFPLCKVAYY